MNKIFLLLAFIVLTSSLQAYSKKIVMATFSNKENATKMIESLPEVAPSVYKLSKKHKFIFKTRKSGKYYILIAEKFTDKKVLNTTLKKIKRAFKGAYSNNYTPPKELEKPKAVKPKKVIVVKKEKIKQAIVKKIVKKEKTPKAIVKKVVKPEKIELVKKENIAEKPIVKKVIPVKKEIIKPKKELVKEEPKNSSQLETAKQIFADYFQWWYAVLLIIAGVLTYYYIKFKKIYDEY